LLSRIWYNFDKVLCQNPIYFDMAKNIAYLRVSKNEENIENQREAIRSLWKTTS